nr:immunoglobulin heavy chain junction region [Macaca mulatta]MOW98868.1 immunoglobulin heavy chain junction region [Macaca mulatta]MOW99546.1 immunoglobulin heavy chain junction region [Macaca mulatta]MOW99555.1 immunoglobulin heavy chain junction region [Macaca mulatta]MOW99654.1 immunoglobulin heavy chain junction region [Macaca mulatta]
CARGAPYNLWGGPFDYW